jgi:hypothetical protein
MAYTNQKKITIHRNIPDVKKGTNRTFLSVYSDVVETAAQNLNGAAFKAFIYLLMNKPEYPLYYSPEHFVKTFGVGLSSAKKVCDELLAAGYLVEIEPQVYEFYEEPQVKKAAMVLKVEKRGFPVEEGSEQLEWHTLAEVIRIYQEAGYTKEDALAAWDRDGIKGGN